VTTAEAILHELRTRGATVYRRGDEVRMRPAHAITPELLERVKRHKAALLTILPGAPPASAVRTVPRADTPHRSSAMDSCGPWIVSSAGDGAMRLLVATPPPWPSLVHEAAAIVEVIDRHHQDCADSLAHVAAEGLAIKLAALSAQGIEAWLAC
jgi:hypothetical protein